MANHFPYIKPGYVTQEGTTALYVRYNFDRTKRTFIEILGRYNYALPKIPSYTFNVQVKELGERAKLKQKIEIVRKKGKNREKKVFEKWEMISSHTCWRSFCTNMYLSGFPVEELMRISGHKSPAAFMRYIKADNQQSARRLKELSEGEIGKINKRFIREITE
jgi:hypothetical protein